ncbi:MAG TPA: hypothetical protein VGH40_17310 [Roseiarcus sp.]|jgi:hypothetical protein
MVAAGLPLGWADGLIERARRVVQSCGEALPESDLGPLRRRLERLEATAGPAGAAVAAG